MRYVSLLRGINVGGRLVKMADLKACYEAAGCADVTTLLQSGNVVFSNSLADPEQVRQKLEAAVTARFNYPAKIMVLPHAGLQPLVDHYPFDASNTERQHYILFLRPGLAARLAAGARDLDPRLEQVAAGDNVVYWQVTKGMTLNSPFAKLLTKAEFKDHHTARNINTVRKLLALDSVLSP